MLANLAVPLLGGLGEGRFSDFDHSWIRLQSARKRNRLSVACSLASLV